MIDTSRPINTKSPPVSSQLLRSAPGGVPLRLLLAFVAGLVLGGLGNYLAWRWLENPWPFFGWFCPPLLGLVAGLIIDGRRRHAWLRAIAASLLAWSGFILTFLVIAHIHWEQQVFTYVPTPAPADPYCSPCFDFTPPPIWFSLQDFFVLGLVFVVPIALVTNVVMNAARRLSGPRSPRLRNSLE